MAELFARHEINTAPRWPRLSKILVGSLVLHLLAGVAFNYIPLARGIFRILGQASDTEFVDEDYQRTIVQDQVTMLTLKNGKFQYPEGFFAANAPEPPPVIVPVSTPPVVPLPKPAPSVAQLPTPAPLPPTAKNTPGSKDGDKNGVLPPTDEVAKNNPTPTPPPAATPAPANPDASVKDAGNRELDRIAAEKNVPRPRKDKMNMRPFDDLWARINAAQQPNWSGNAEVELTGERSPEDTLPNLRRVNAAGDPSLVKFLTDLAAAAGDSRVVQFIKGPSEFHLKLKFDGPNVVVRIEADAASPDAAVDMARTYGAMVLAAKFAKKGDEEEIYFKNASVKADGSTLVLMTTLKREEAVRTLNKQLAAAADKAQKKQSATQTP
jgi:hypothetical protein